MHEPLKWSATGRRHSDERPVQYRQVHARHPEQEKGLLPPKAVLSHVAVLSHPNYPKFLIMSDMAVIPAPDLGQKVAIAKYLVNTAHALGIPKPKLAFVTATEQMLPECLPASTLPSSPNGRPQTDPRLHRRRTPGLDVCLSPEAVAIKSSIALLQAMWTACSFPTSKVPMSCTNA